MSSINFSASSAKWVNKPEVTISTTLGKFVIELFPESSPVTVENFLDYVSSKFYEGLLIHRVIPEFVIQMGGFEPTMRLKVPPNDPIKLESNNGESNLRGTVGMARLSDPSYNSATSQFFVNLVDNRYLDYKSDSSPGYAVFGAVSAGMDVIDQIAQLSTQTVFPHQNVPVSDVVIHGASLSQLGMLYSTDGDLVLDGIVGGDIAKFSLDGGVSWSYSFERLGDDYFISLPEGAYSPGTLKLVVVHNNGTSQMVPFIPATQLVVDKTPPSVSVSVESLDTDQVGSYRVSFLLSEQSRDFDSADVAVTGGVLTNFSGTGVTYSAIFIADVDDQTISSV